jgi:hypothetical protein
MINAPKIDADEQQGKSRYSDAGYSAAGVKLRNTKSSNKREQRGDLPIGDYQRRL